ncbi:hypothetical protein N8690_00655 [bacterium]|nr:hypothetical protein [bacterium]
MVQILLQGPLVRLKCQIWQETNVHWAAMIWEIHQDCTLKAGNGIEGFFDETIRACLHRSGGAAWICGKTNDCLGARSGLRQL